MNQIKIIPNNKIAAKIATIQIMEDVLGCKWSLMVLQAVKEGVCRPGAIERCIPGLSTKILNERLRKLLRYGIMCREVYPESPPKVEYRLTNFGNKFSKILDAIQELDKEIQDIDGVLPTNVTNVPQKNR